MNRVAVIGGGINGVMIAWALAKHGLGVDLYEKNTLMAATSSASSKMLHGGLRYLEHGNFRLVRKALQERAWWLKHAPDFTKQFELLFPLYKGSGRSKIAVRLATALYSFLARGTGFPVGHWYKPQDVLALLPNINPDRLLGAYSFWDGQMDDYRLGLWAVDQARKCGVYIHEHTEVTDINPAKGTMRAGGEAAQFDLIVNATGPWANRVLCESSIESAHLLDLVQGTHVLIDGDIKIGCVLQVPQEKRIIFVLPYKGKTLIGTTETKVASPENCKPTDGEVDYLLSTYNQCFSSKLTRAHVKGVFSGVRPIVSERKNFSKASRESIIEKNGKLINVFGGKWTTSRSLAQSVLSLTRQLT